MLTLGVGGRNLLGRAFRGEKGERVLWGTAKGNARLFAEEIWEYSHSVRVCTFCCIFFVLRRLECTGERASEEACVREVFV